VESNTNIFFNSNIPYLPHVMPQSADNDSLHPKSNNHQQGGVLRQDFGMYYSSNSKGLPRQNLDTLA
jgi:hypothetical protein